MNIVEKKLGELQPYENNPRKNDTAVPSLVLHFGASMILTRS